MRGSDIKDLLLDDKAVSTTVAVILMVGIVVVLSTVAGAIFLGTGEALKEPTPNARLDIKFDDEAVDGTSQKGNDRFSDRVDRITITYNGGENMKVGPTGYGVTEAELFILMDQPFEEDAGYNNYECSGYMSASDSDDVINGSKLWKCPFDYYNPTNSKGDNELVAGDQFVIYPSCGNIEFNNANMKITYEPKETDDTFILLKWSGPGGDQTTTNKECKD